jgi:hypothetical protein
VERSFPLSNIGGEGEEAGWNSNLRSSFLRKLNVKREPKRKKGTWLKSMLVFSDLSRFLKLYLIWISNHIFHFKQDVDFRVLLIA